MESMVTNEYGAEVSYIDAVNIMDRDICESLNDEMAPCTDQEFFDAYCEAHRTKYDEEFAPNTLDMAW